MSQIKIKSLHIYPVKSLGGIDIESSEVERRGLKYDRRWMLVDENGQFISQRKYAKLSLLRAEIKADSLSITDTTGQQGTIDIPLATPKSKSITVTIWDDTCMAKPLNDSVNNWFSEFMNMPVSLVYMHEDSERKADPRYATSEKDIVSFADGYPILILSQASLDLLNQKTEEHIPADRFRANIIIEGVNAHEEDELQTISNGEVQLVGVKPCARCVMTTIDQQTAEKGKEPLESLSTYRKEGKKILFGYNFIPTQLGAISVGDSLKKN